MQEDTSKASIRGLHWTPAKTSEAILDGVARCC